MGGAVFSSRWDPARWAPVQAAASRQPAQTFLDDLERVISGARDAVECALGNLKKYYGRGRTGYLGRTESGWQPRLSALAFSLQAVVFPAGAQAARGTGGPGQRASRARLDPLGLPNGLWKGPPARTSTKPRLKISREDPKRLWAMTS